MIAFLLREGWRNLANLGIIGLLCLASLSITLSLSGLAVRGYLIVDEWKTGVLGRFEVEAFLDADVDSLNAIKIADRIEGMADVAGVIYISKELAAQRFGEQFGEDLFDLLEYNPLPSSLVVTLKKDANPAKSWARTSDAIAAIPGVDDVVYEGDLLASVSKFYQNVGTSVGIVVGLALIVSLVLTILSVQNAIRSKEDFIRIVALSGGTNLMARGPFIALGGYYGLISGLTASGVIALLGWIIRFGWGLGSTLPLWWIPALMLGGALIGMIGSGWAAGSRIRRI